MFIQDEAPTQNEKDQDLIDFFKEMGYQVCWDFSKSDGLHWHEFIDPNTKRLALQVEMGKSLNEFLKEWNCDDHSIPLKFFISTDNDSEEFPILKANIDAKISDLKREMENSQKMS
jgi:hypothetical protein